MNLYVALLRIPSTSNLNAFMWAMATGTTDILEEQCAAGVDHITAKAQVAYYENRLRACQHDGAWWGYKSQLVFWQTVCRLFEAAELLGSEELPDLTPPRIVNKVTMDAIELVEQYGKQVLQQAQERAAILTRP